MTNFKKILIWSILFELSIIAGLLSNKFLLVFVIYLSWKTIKLTTEIRRE